MEYINIQEASAIWQISERRIRKLLVDGRIEKAYKKSNIWFIPKDSCKPIDKRSKIKEEFIINLPDNYFEEIEFRLKELLNKYPIDKEVESNIREYIDLLFIFNSNAIEGNSLTLKETKVVLEGYGVGGKSIDHIIEVRSLRKSLDYVNIVYKGKELTEHIIKSIHQLILEDINKDIAGVYRKGNVLISGANHVPPSGIVVTDEMEKLIYRYKKWSNYHPLVRAALLHGEFVKIHPFNDGNGRTARMLLIYEAMKYGYPPIVIDVNNKNDYYEALDKAHTTNDYTDFIELVTKEALKMIYIYLTTI